MPVLVKGVKSGSSRIRGTSKHTSRSVASTGGGTKGRHGNTSQRNISSRLGTKERPLSDKDTYENEGATDAAMESLYNQLGIDLGPLDTPPDEEDMDVAGRQGPLPESMRALRESDDSLLDREGDEPVPMEADRPVGDIYSREGSDTMFDSRNKPQTPRPTRSINQSEWAKQQHAKVGVTGRR